MDSSATPTTQTSPPTSTSQQCLPELNPSEPSTHHHIKSLWIIRNLLSLITESHTGQILRQ
uniref:Uncharacterized protein n=1 Tax=Anguilla anguilla TaxID=7936 RepID=A0A0E9XZK6_ANGAN